MTVFDINQIQKLLPHRYPFLLVDRVVAFEKGKSIRAYKNVSFNEPYFTGHFPQKPIMPGVLILEALAQAAGILAFGTLDVEADDNSVYYLVGIDGARFKRPVEPGDQLTLEVELVRQMRNIYKFNAVARVGDEMVAEAELMCTERVID
ncbi:MAG: 3-hydroxyacyl-ACP dehydratase FabZ [Betaproteobacteria bacterium]|jgi:3-hydroxyacyl-[acyl-carrier-protein] dehydratase|nr:3-hydroxyacyl-ACP dehydratase FabZ [Betaproteobacteria bacterium]